MQPFDPHRTALILIDLQKGILERPLAPYSADAVLSASTALAQRFRDAGAPVVLVHVGFAPDYADAPRQPVDEAPARPEGGLPDDWMAFAPDLWQPGDLVVHKRQWGAFYGTDLDLQLRRRKIDTIVLGGVATNFGVESTARAAWERGYAVVLAEDACSSFSDMLHAFSVQHVMPRIARVVRSSEIGLSVDGAGA